MVSLIVWKRAPGANVLSLGVAVAMWFARPQGRRTCRIAQSDQSRYHASLNEDECGNPWPQCRVGLWQRPVTVDTGASDIATAGDGDLAHASVQKDGDGKYCPESQPNESTCFFAQQSK
jgi:hypothetical protein